MPSIPIIMPQLGESIAEATVINLLVQVGDHVEADQDIIEVETNKATMNVASPCPGRVEKFLVKLNESYPVGAVLGYSKPARKTPRGWAWTRPPPAETAKSQPKRLAPAACTPTAPRKSVQPTVRGLPVPGERRRRQLHVAAHEGAHGRTGPARRRPGGHRRQRRGRPRDHPGFREIHRQPREAQAEPGLDHARGRGRCHAPQLDAAARAPSACRSASTRCLRHRKTCNPKPGPALYALRALALALAENSAPAGRLIGNKIVHPSSIDVGFAVEAEDGVLVPVIRNADKQLLKDLVAALRRTGRTGAPAQAARRRHRRLHRHRHELRHLRPHLGHADSAAGADAGAGHGRGAARAELGRGQRPVRARHGSQPDAELRPSRARWRRRRPVARPRRSTAGLSRKALVYLVCALSGSDTADCQVRKARIDRIRRAGTSIARFGD